MWHGCAMVASKYPERQAEGDIFEYSIDTIVNIGFTTTMSYCNSGFDQDYDGEDGFTPTPTTFKTLLETAAYQYLFGQSIPRHFLQLWTFANGPASDPPAIQASSAQLLAEYNEVYEAACYLLATYSNKEFIIKNWEGDWQLLNGFDPTINPPSYRAERFVAFFSARQRAIHDACRDTPSTSTVKYCLELNRCLDDYGSRMHNDVLPYVKPDMVGWSAYEAINYWTQGWTRTAPEIYFSGENINAMAYGNGVYVVVGDAGKISTSTDGETWIPRVSQFSSDNILGVCWVPNINVFVAVGAAGKLSTSIDGYTWTARTSGTANALNGVISDGFAINAFGVSSTLIYSADGTNWSDVSWIGPAPTTDFTVGVADTVTGNSFIGGTSGKIAYCGGPIAIDQSASAGLGSNTVRCIAIGGGRVVVGGDGGAISTSAAGPNVPFSAKTSQFGFDAIYGLAYGGGTWVAVGTNGKISTSTDNGQTWTARTSGTGAYLNAVDYSATDESFAYGCDGATGYSFDGITWLVNGQAAMGGLNVNCMLSGPGVSLTAADDGILTVARNWHVQTTAEANIDFYLRKGFDRIADAARAGTPICISEYGFPQDQTNFTGLGLDVGRLIQKVIDTADDLGMAGVIYWQVFDNEEQSPGVTRGFHLYTRDGNASTPGALSAAGVKYASIL